MIKCKKCGEKVQKGKYCSNCGAELNYESVHRYENMKNDIRSMTVQKEISIDMNCFWMALDIYFDICGRNVSGNDCTDEDVQKITGIAEDICELALKYKKSAKAATNAD